MGRTVIPGQEAPIIPTPQGLHSEPIELWLPHSCLEKWDPWQRSLDLIFPGLVKHCALVGTATRYPSGNTRGRRTISHVGIVDVYLAAIVPGERWILGRCHDDLTRSIDAMRIPTGATGDRGCRP